jgi:hypothetical protein
MIMKNKKKAGDIDFDFATGFAALSLKKQRIF